MFQHFPLAPHMCIGSKQFMTLDQCLYTSYSSRSRKSSLTLGRLVPRLISRKKEKGPEYEGKHWVGAQQNLDLIMSRYVQTPILATLVSSKFANFGNQQHLPNLATDDTCQFWQLLCPHNLPILATDNICQFWQLITFANFGK